MMDCRAHSLLIVSCSVQIKRAQWIAKWVTRLQAGVVRASSEALDLGLAYLKDWRKSGRTCDGDNNDAYNERAQAPSALLQHPPDSRAVDTSS